ELTEALAAFQREQEVRAARPQANPPRPSFVHYCRSLIQIDRLVPAVVAGQFRPANVQEELALVLSCSIRHHFAPAARLAEQGFATPDTPASLRATWVLRAARAAARASCGQGKDAPPADADRARWRRRAREWLGEDLRSWKARLAGAGANARAE